MSAPGFRATNLILHLLSCFLLYHLIVLFIKDRRTALLAALLFSLHPANTESVSWVVSRNNILVTLFSLLSFYFYVKAWKGQGYLKILISVFFFGLATLSKEFALMLIPIMFLYQRLIREKEKDVRKELFMYLPYLFVLVCYFILRQSATGSLLSSSDMGNLWSRIYFAPYVIIYHLKCAVFPYHLHSYGVNYPASFLDWKALGSILVLSLLGVMLWRARDYKWVLFASLSFLVSLVPVLNIMPTAAVSLVAMRWLYFPMSFLSIALAWAIREALPRRRFVALSCFWIALVYMGSYAYVLNKGLWQKEKNFFRHEVLQFNNPLYAAGLAELYLDEKNYKDAEKYFKESLKYYPHKARTYINYSALLIETGRPDAALSRLNEAKSLTMTRNERGEWFNNRGMAHFKLRNKDGALKDFWKAVKYAPNEPSFWANLGGAYGSMGDYSNSVSLLKRGLEIAPDSTMLRKNLAVTYMKMEHYEKAIATLEKIPPQERKGRGEIKTLLSRARHQLLTKENGF